MDTKFVEPTYRLRPHEELKFSPPAVSRISEEVVKAMLSDKKWIGEGEEAVWTVQITEQVKSKVIGEWEGIYLGNVACAHLNRLLV